MKILIIRFSSLGDITMATALPRVLRKRFPEAEIDMIVREDFKDVIEENPNINNKIYLSRTDGIRGLIKLTNFVRHRGYDLIVDAHRSIRSRFICAFNPLIKKVYFDKRTFKRLMLIFFKINLFKRVDLNMLEYIKPLHKFGVEYDGLGTEIVITKNTKDKVRDIISTRIETFKKRKLIGLIPSAHWPGKRWPASKFNELVGIVVDKLDADVLIIGGKRDTFCEEIASAYNNVYSFAGEFSIAESAAALSVCDLVVSNDTGMMHVAEAVGRDVIGIMGPTSWEFGCYPYRRGSRVVELNMWCRPCSKNGWGPCIRWGRRPCLNNISADMVFDEIIDYFGETLR